MRPEGPSSPRRGAPPAPTLLSRRRLLGSGLLAGVGLVASPMLNLGRCRLLGQEPVEVSTRAVDLVQGSTVIDMLGLFTLDWPKLFDWYRHPERFGDPDLRLLGSSGVNVFHPAVETSARDPYEGARRWILGWNRLLRAHGGCFLARVDTIDDLLVAPRRHKIGVLLGFQNSNHFRTVADVAAFHRAGQRVSQLTYNGHNRLGSGCYESADRGLTPYGAEVVAEMNRLGMVVDVSHCGERTSREAVAASRRPVLVTHSNCKALVPWQPRCKSDRVIRLMAAGGGVMGITVVRAFVGASPDLDDLLDHFDHVARLVGIEHLGLGSDVDVTAANPKTGRPYPFYAIRGLDPVARVFQIADGLLKRGYRDRHVELVLGGNFLRALAAVFPDSPSPPRERELRRDPFCPVVEPPAPVVRARR